ncbi:MAG: flavodoxin, partial [Thermoleophilia bacterium]|nr:flavodoxin [Thermoleophilia bacterium]
MAGQPAILVAYATKKGSTREVAEEIGGALVKRGLLADVRPASEVRSLEPYTGVVLGGALHRSLA